MRTTKLLISVPCFPNVKNEPRQQEEKKLMALVKKHMNANSLIVDFGCGTSYYTGKEAVGIELDRVLLKRADLHHKILADFHHVPLKSESVDAVVMCHSLEHTNVPWMPIKQAFRILKEKGVIGISVPNALSVKSIYRLLFKQELITVAVDHLWSFTPKILQWFLVANGFKIIADDGDIVYTPLMKRLHLMKLGYFLARLFSKLSNVYIVVGRKT